MAEQAVERFQLAAPELSAHFSTLQKFEDPPARPTWAFPLGVVLFPSVSKRPAPTLPWFKFPWKSRRSGSLPVIGDALTRSADAR